MPKRSKGKRVILDSSVLLRWWNQRRSNTSQPLSGTQVARWAEDLVLHHDSNAILTPVHVEVVGGASSESELRLLEAYLAVFECVDGQRILAEDWREAIRLARRVGRDRRPRDLGDCLIRAVAKRLKYDVETLDRGFPH